MKKWSAIMLIFAIMWNLTCSCFAGTVFTEIEELNLTVDVPDNYHLLTRDIGENDPYLKEIGVTYDELLVHFRASDIYLNGIDYDNLSEFILTMREIPESQAIYDLSNLSDEELKEAINYFLNYSEMSEEKLYYDSNILKTDSATFLALKFRNRDGVYIAEGIQYYTVHNGQAINLIFSAYDNSYIETAFEDMDKMIKSVKFTKELETPAIGSYSGTDIGLGSGSLNYVSLPEGQANTEILLKIIIAVICVYFIYKLFAAKNKRKAGNRDARL